MANPISQKLKIGSIGELFVQARFLEFDIQAAPPLKDSGNDLVALRGRNMKLIQVKTTTVGRFPDLPEEKVIYDILAIVVLAGFDTVIKYDETSIYLIPKDSVGIIPRDFSKLERYKLSSSIHKLWLTRRCRRSP